MENFWISLKDHLTANTVLSSIAVILFNFIVYTIISRAIRKKRQNGANRFAIGNRGRTYINLFVSIFRYVMILLTVLIVLKINHVDVTTILASVGVVSVIVGLALQDALKDIIRGFSLLSDSYFQVGDYVTIGDKTEGKVLVIGLKTTRIQNMTDGSIISIANRNIEQVKVAGDHYMHDIPLPYELKVGRAEEITEEIVAKAKESENVRDCKYVGVQELGESSVVYRIRVDQVPGKKIAAKREINKIIMETCEAHRISIPYKQIDIHNIK